MPPYYDPANLERIPELARLAPEAAASFRAFEKDVHHTSSALPEKTKELIATAVAHVTGCPYCIDVHVRKSKALGATKEELFEAVLVAASTRAGAILSHATHALEAFGDEEDGAGGQVEKREGAADSEARDTREEAAPSGSGDSGVNAGSGTSPAARPESKAGEAGPDCFC